VLIAVLIHSLKPVAINNGGNQSASVASSFSWRIKEEGVVDGL